MVYGAISDIFSDGMEGFLSGLLNEALRVFDSGLRDIADIAFRADTYMTSEIGMNLDNLFLVLRLFGLYLVVLKFLKKGFDIYILWSEGDADMDPFILATGFFKAIVITVTFNTLYDYVVKIILDMMNRVLNSINNVNLDTASLIGLLSQYIVKGLIMLIIAIVYLIFYLILWIQFIQRGLEIFILKAGIPLASVGLMDSDGGVFRPYIKKFTQEIFTVLVQTFILKLSIAFMMNGHFMFGIAAIGLSLKAPQFLQEFIMLSGGGQGVVSKTTQTIYTANMVRSFVR